MSNIPAVGSVPSFITSTNVVSRINWRLAGKVSLIALGVFLLAATLLCLGVKHSLRNELTEIQRGHSQPLTEAQRQDWLARARTYLWPQLTEEEALIAANNALVPLQEGQFRIIDFEAPSLYYLINERLNDPVFQANPQRGWNLWRFHRGDAEYASPDDSAASFFVQELGFTTTPSYRDLSLLRYYRFYRGFPGFDAIFFALIKARIRVSVRSLFGML